MHGHEGKNLEIRTRIVEYQRNNPNDFKPFMTVQGGAPRRNPKRKNAKASSTSQTFEFTEATPAQIDAAWEQHLTEMAVSGEWGDNMEIQAFAKAYDMDVLVFTYNNTNYYVRASDKQDGVDRPIVYIALHVSIPYYYAMIMH